MKKDINNDMTAVIENRKARSGRGEKEMRKG